MSVLSPRSRAAHGIAEEVIIAQRHMTILAACHPGCFDSLVFREHVVRKAAAACAGLASGAGLWCSFRLLHLQLLAPPQDMPCHFQATQKVKEPRTT